VSRQFEPEAGAAARAVVEADAALHHLDQPLADRQAQTGAAFLAGGGRIGLREAAENAVAEVSGMPGAIVNRDPCRCAVLGADVDDLPSRARTWRRSTAGWS
jgi:hypothetical protein